MPKQTVYLASLVTLVTRLDEFEAAVRLHEIKGMYPPEDSIRIENEYKEAKAKFQSILRSLVILAEN